MTRGKNPSQNEVFLQQGDRLLLCLIYNLNSVAKNINIIIIIVNYSILSKKVNTKERKNGRKRRILRNAKANKRMIPVLIFHGICTTCLVADICFFSFFSPSFFLSFFLSLYLENKYSLRSRMSETNSLPDSECIRIFPTVTFYTKKYFLRKRNEIF
jgi:hypothetical protein